MKNGMKNTLLILGLIIGLSAFKMSEHVEVLLKWETKAHDFGKIVKGEAASHTFYFTNEGDQPIQIVKTKSSCGCTVSKHTEGEIKVGEQGFVKAEYNASKSGVFSKSVRVYTSLDENPIVLQVKGEVE